MKRRLIHNDPLITSLLTILIYILYAVTIRIDNIPTILSYVLLAITLINIGLILIGIVNCRVFTKKGIWNLVRIVLNLILLYLVYTSITDE
jgi:hypothetical protein